MAKEKPKMEHTKENLAKLFDELSNEQMLLVRQANSRGEYSVSLECYAKSNAYKHASLLIRFAPEFDKEAKRLFGGDEE